MKRLRSNIEKGSPYGDEGNIMAGFVMVSVTGLSMLGMACLAANYLIPNPPNAKTVYGKLACEGVYLFYRPESTSKVAQIEVTPELVLEKDGKSRPTTGNVMGMIHGNGNLSVNGVATAQTEVNGKSVSIYADVEDSTNNQNFSIDASYSGLRFEYTVSAEQYDQTATCSSGEFTIDAVHQVVRSSDANPAWLNYPG